MSNPICCDAQRSDPRTSMNHQICGSHRQIPSPAAPCGNRCGKGAGSMGADESDESVRPSERHIDAGAIGEAHGIDEPVVVGADHDLLDNTLLPGSA